MNIIDSQMPGVIFPQLKWVVFIHSITFKLGNMGAYYIISNSRGRYSQISPEDPPDGSFKDKALQTQLINLKNILRAKRNFISSHESPETFIVKVPIKYLQSCE